MGLSRAEYDLGFSGSKCLGWGKEARPCLAVKPALKKFSFLWEGANCRITSELVLALRSCLICGHGEISAAGEAGSDPSKGSPFSAAQLRF